MRRMFTLLSLLLALAMVTVACGESKDTGFSPAPETQDEGDGHGGEGEGGGDHEFDPSPEPQTEPATELTIQAKGIAFNRTEMLFAADTPIALTFENLDSAIDHNVAIYTDDGPGDELFKGEIFPGVETKQYQVPPIAAGSYYFQCDVHPNMAGTATFE